MFIPPLSFISEGIAARNSIQSCFFDGSIVSCRVSRIHPGALEEEQEALVRKLYEIY